MSCAAIMTKDPLTIGADESVSDAAAKLVAHRQSSLPVVDADGRYAGMFGLYDLLSLLVPRVALAGNLMSNLRFIIDDPGELRRRFVAVKSRRVGDAANRSAATLHPDSSEIEAIRHFCCSHDSLPVIEKDSGRIVGIVTSWDAIRALAAPAQA